MSEAELFAAHGLVLEAAEGRPGPLRFERPLGSFERSACWRDRCREKWPNHLTVQDWTNGLVVAWCHREVYSSRDSFEFRAEAHAHGLIGPRKG